MSRAGESLTGFGAATIHEANGRHGMLDPSLRPLWPGARVCGPARCVRCGIGDNLALHRALAVASSEEVLVVQTGNDVRHGAWGEIMTVAALERSVAGLVTDGAVRDVAEIERLRFPVFAAGIAVGGCDKLDPGSIDAPVVVGGITVSPGDIVVGDADGVVVVAADRAEAVARAAAARDAHERDLIDRIRAGATTYELLGLSDG